MVCKDEIIDWFSRQPSHQRLDVLCTLASMCLPFEIRFLNTCVDFLARKDAPAARDSEILNSIEKNQFTLDEADIHDDNLRRKLIFKLTLLHAGNRIVAHTIFQILCNISADLKVVGPGMVSSELSHELHLIFTMVLHHPSFTLEERVKLSEIYLCMQSQYPVQRPSSSATTNSPSPVSLYGSSPLSSPVPDVELTKTSSGTSNLVTVISNPTCEISDRPVNSPSRKQSQSQTTQREHRRNHPRNTGSSSESRSSSQPKNGHSHAQLLANGVDIITQQFKEQLGRERVPKCWHKLENLSGNELLNLTDQELQDMGWTGNSITRFRKTLKNICQSNHKSTNGSSSSYSSGVISNNTNCCNSNMSSNSSSSSSEGLAVPNPSDHRNQSPERSHSSHHSSIKSQPFQSVLVTNKFAAITSTSTSTPSSSPSSSSSSLSSSTSTSTPRSALLKSGCVGPPNVQPAFNNCPKPVTRDAVENPPNASQPLVQEPTSRAGSSNSTVSSLETCSPPSSPTEPNKNLNNTTHKNRKPIQHYSVGCTSTSFHAVPQSLVIHAPVTGSRPQSRAPCSSTSSSIQGSSRGANNNTSYMRPSPSPTYSTSSNSGSSTSSNSNSSSSTSTSGISSGSSNCNNGTNNVRQQQLNNRAASQPRDLPYPLNISFSGGGPQQPSTPFILDSATPPPNLEAAALPVYSYHHPYYTVHGDGIQAQSLSQPQPPFTFIPSGPPPSNSSLGNRPPLTGPHDMSVYPPTSYFVQGHIVAQPIAPPHGSNANVRPSLMDIQYLPPGPLILTTRPDVADYSRPPPPGTNSGAGGTNLASGSASVSCFNCGASGHRGSQCKETPLEEIIKPSSLV